MSIRKNGFKKMKMILLTGILATGLLTGCGNDAQSKEDSSVTTVKVGTRAGGVPGLWYEDENGNLTGYAVEMLYAIDEKLPEYQFEYVLSSDLTGVLTALDSKKVQIGEHLFSKTPEREEKYLFGDVGYYYNKCYITTLAEHEDWNTIEDFAGKVVGVIQGEAFAAALEDWNAEHPGQEVILEYISWGTDEENYSLLASGRVDGLTDGTHRTVETWNNSFGGGSSVVKITEEAVFQDVSFLLFNKEDAALKEAVDKALQELKDDGTLSELSIRFQGYDYSN